MIRRAAGAACAVIMFLSAAAGISAQDDLLQRTLVLDIATASYYELATWCDSLGLPSAGSTADLRARLFAHYSISAPAETAPSSGKGRTITIRSADATEYYTDGDSGEKYIFVYGNVILEMKDDDDGSFHSISADSIVVNQTRKTVTATGNLRYLLTEDGNEESFRGDGLSFSYDTWEGVFLRGASEKDRTIDDKTIPFTYAGERILRVDSDTIILRDGTVTSSKPIDPYYRIEASDILVLSAGEWGLRNVVLYIGRIPVFYFPFFFKPGDELVFHPSLNTRISGGEGFGVQTTTYLIGERERQESAFSFLQLGDELSGEYGMVRRGMFLTRSEEKREGEAEGEDYVKLIADLYSRLGLFAGIEGALTPGEVLRSLDFLVLLAFTRNIYDSDMSPYGYTVFTEFPDGTVDDVWNSTRLLGLSLPFRYAADLSFDLRGKSGSLTGRFPLYSDTSVMSDLGERSEKIDWARILGVAGGEVSQSGSVTDISSFTWLLEGAFNPGLESLRPYVSQISVSDLDASVSWLSRDSERESAPGTSPSAGPHIDPERFFFYPHTMRLPVLSASITGTLYDSAARKGGDDGDGNGAGEEGLPEPRAPFESPDEDTSEAETDGEGGEAPDLRIPPPSEDIPIPRPTQRAPSTQRLTYRLQPAFTLDTRTDSDGWAVPEDIDMAIAYSIISTRPTASISYDLAFLGTVFALSDTLRLAASYYRHIEDSPTLENLQQDYKNTNTKLTNTLRLTSKPFPGFSRISGSSATYSLGMNLYATEFVELTGTQPVYDTILPGFDDDSIFSHSIAADFVLDADRVDWRMKVDAVIPPLDPVIGLFTSVGAGPYGADVSSAVRKTDELWVFDPLEINQKLSFLRNSSIAQSIVYDIEAGTWDTATTNAVLSFLENDLSLRQSVSFDLSDRSVSRSVTSLHAWLLDASLTAASANSFSFEPGAGWRMNDDEEFRAQRVDARLVYAYESDPLWKNRISMDLESSLSWYMNLLKFNDNALVATLSYTLSIAEFIDLKFSSRSVNRATYLYFPGLVARVPNFDEPLNPVIDLLRSFNLFDRTDREGSNFNLQSIEVSAVHYLRDWDLEIEYSGRPILDTESGVNRYVWGTELSIFVSWKPVPEIKRRVRIDDGEIDLE